MEPGQEAPWRALARASRLQSEAAPRHRPSPSCVASKRSPQRTRRRVGRPGWRRDRFDVRVAVEQQLAEFDLIEYTQEELDFLDAGHDSPWYGCGVDGCCVDSEWWAPVMPSRAFLRDGLVHMSLPWSRNAYCGEPSVPYGVQVCSTDAVLEYARLLSIEVDEVTCLACIVAMGEWSEVDDFLVRP